MFWNAKTSQFSTLRQAVKWLHETGHAVRKEPSDDVLSGHRIYRVTMDEKPTITATQTLDMAGEPHFPVILFAAGDLVDPDDPDQVTYDEDVPDRTKPHRAWVVHDMTPEEIGAHIQLERGPACKAECARRIYAVADQPTQTNLASRAPFYTDDDLTTYKAGIDWIADMQAAARAMAVDLTKDYLADENWPAVPAGVQEMADRF